MIENIINVTNDALYGYVLINLPVIFCLGKYAFRALRDYERQLKAGGPITFRKKDIDLPHETDYWN